MRDLFAGILMITTGIAYSLLHLWTAYLFYVGNGFIWGAVAFCCPVLSPMVMAGARIASNGFFDGYVIILASIFLTYAAAALIASNDKINEC
jgi:hypothetical protein